MDFEPLLNYGVLGIMFIIVVTGFLVPKPTHDREVKRGDDATSAAAKNAEAVRDTAGLNKTLVDTIKEFKDQFRDEVRELKTEIKALQEEVKGLKAELRDR